MAVNGVLVNDVNSASENNQGSTGIDSVSYINIDITEDYFNSDKQIAFKNQSWFVDRFLPLKTENNNKVVGYFYSQRDKKNTNANFHEYNSGSIDPYRQGVEIKEFKHWAAGYGKLTAGTPGHIIDPRCFGVNDLNIVSANKFVEINLFNPIEFVNLQTNDKLTFKKFQKLITYPIITSDANQAENYILNGIIEPLPIRSVISFFSINVPFEPHSIKADFSAGNSNVWRANDYVTSKDYYEPSKKNQTPFLDAVDMIALEDENSSAVVGPAISYFNIDSNKTTPFTDDILPRGQMKSSYTGDLRNAILLMENEGTTYISQKERTATTGFVYDDVGYAGTDSIAYGGMSY